jgi:hypothetical protein
MSNIHNLIFVFLILLAKAPVAAEETMEAPAVAPAANTGAQDESSLWGGAPTKKEVVNHVWSYAAGFNLIWSRRVDYGVRVFSRFEPEAAGFMYTELPVGNLWLRHGARLGYSHDQPQMPQSLRLEETDWKASIEEGLVYNWLLCPSLTAGVGYDWRTIKLKTSSPITTSDSRLNTTESFLWTYLQAGLGIPTMGGRFMIEPVARYQHLVSDSRTKWAFGLEINTAW